MASRLWEYHGLKKGLKVPDWYCFLYGTSPWHLSRRCSLMNETQRARAFLVRINYQIDLLSGFFKPDSPPKQSLKCLLRSRYPGSSLVDLIKLGQVNVTWAHRTSYNVLGALACACKKYMSILPPVPTCTRPPNPKGLGRRGPKTPP